MKETQIVKDEAVLQQLPQSNIQNRTIDFIFLTARKMCDKEEQIADYTHQTGSMRATRLAVSMVMKYMPNEIKDKIRDLFKTLEKELKKIDENQSMDPNNKKLNKRAKEDEICMDILTLCIVTLTYGSISTELKEINILEGFDKLIEQTRTSKPVNLFKEEEPT